MSKVLISFLGTGSLPIDVRKNFTKESRQYRTADYRIDGKELGSYPFVSAALKKHYEIDSVILIGTVHSMWEEVYRWSAGDDVKDDIYMDIADHCEKASYESALEIPHHQEIEKSLGINSRVVLIKYGLNQEEIKENLELILNLEQFLRKGDQLVVDITHSFRSLPLYLMNLLIYLENVSSKKIKISNITYGMLDISHELGYTPIVELNSLMEVNDWISGAYSFTEFGNAYKIATLLENGYKDVSNRLQKFSDVKNLNYLNAIEKQIQELQALRNKELPPLARIVIPPIIEDFLSNFKKCKSHSSFQYCLAKWHFEKRNYSSAYIVLVESIISHVCENNEWDVNDYESREEAKSQLKLDEWNHLRGIYFKTNKYRNEIAHNLTGKVNFNTMIKELDKNLKEFGNLINRK